MCPQENVTIRVKQLLPFHPLTHVQVLGAVHCLLVLHWGLQIANLCHVLCTLITSIAYEDSLA